MVLHILSLENNLENPSDKRDYSSFFTDFTSQPEK